MNDKKINIENPEIGLVENKGGEQEIAQQREFYKIPARFGAEPENEAPFRYDTLANRR